MRKALGLAIAILVGVGISLYRKALVRWAAEQVLGFLVGTQVKVEALQGWNWHWDGHWGVSLRGVRVASTLPGDTAAAAYIAELRLVGQRKTLDTVCVRGAALAFVRLSKSQKNFRFFPRRGRGQTHPHVVVHAEDIRLYLDNLPPKLSLSVQASAVQAQVFIDRAQVRIREGKATLSFRELCIRDKLWPLPHHLRLRLEGTYQKGHDLWEGLQLRLWGEGFSLAFEGSLAAWEKPTGWLYAQLDSAQTQAVAQSLSLSPKVSEASVTAWVQERSYAGMLWGRWAGRPYEICLQGYKTTLFAVEGKLALPFAQVHFWGKPPWLAVGGAFHYKGLYGWGEGLINLRQQTGRLTLRTASGDAVEVSGSVDSLKGEGHIKGMPFKLVWKKPKGLTLYLDTVVKDTLLQAFSSYRFLVEGKGHALPMEAHCQQLIWDSLTYAQAIRFWLRDTFLWAEGRVRYRDFPSFAVRVGAPLGLQRGWVAVENTLGYIFGEWEGDSLRLSGTGRWTDILWTAAGEGSLAERRLWLYHGVAESPRGDWASVSGAFSLQGADASLSAKLDLPWLLQVLPLEGLTLSQGKIALHLCARGSWDTLLRWDNPTEGEATLTQVKGFFPRIGLPLENLSLRLTYSPEETLVETLSAQIGPTVIHASGHLQGTLSYLYTDWYRLKGHLQVTADRLPLDAFWRQVESQATRRRVRLPQQMDLQLVTRLSSIDIYGLNFPYAYLTGGIQGGLITVDTLLLSYAEGHIQAHGTLDAQDTACYMLVGRLQPEGVEIAHILRDFSLDTLETLRRLGLRGRFSGQGQVALRFAPSVQWRDQSSLWASGRIYEGSFKTPRFLRWFRPYYLAAYKDSMDFLAEIPTFQLTDGFLRIEDAFLLTRVAAFRMYGYHYLTEDRFFYRLQGARLYRRVQRQPTLSLLPTYVMDLVDRSLFLLYVEKSGKKVRWYYPWRYLLRRLVQFRWAEPRLRPAKKAFSTPSLGLFP